MPDPFRIFVDGAPIEARTGQSVIEALQQWNADVAASLRAGARALTDSRGLPISPDSPAYAGAIFRVVSARSLREQRDDSEA